MPEKEKKPLFSNIAAVYFKLTNKLRVSFKKGLIGKSGYACKRFPELTACFGFEGDKDAPIAFIDGSYLLRDRNHTFITFGISASEGKINWYNKEGFLPCFVSEMEKDCVKYTIENFADKVTVNSNDYVIAYSRITAVNLSDEEKTLPKVSSMLIPLTECPKTVGAGKAVIRDYAVGADRFGGKYPYPDNEEIARAGGFDEHYNSMKEYWLKRLEPLAEITHLPDERLINAYKAGYIYTMIVKDGTELHVGENGYDRVFDHDIIGILASLVTVGDFKDLKEYAKHILKNIQYPDARWKYSWFFALYLQKTGDISYIRENFRDIKENARFVAESREAPDSIIKKSNAIDSHGNWTIDNWSALTGLCCYRYICENLSEEAEVEWAEKEYNSLLDALNSRLEKTLSDNGINYIPISVTEPNEAGPRSDPRDANWASMFLFGRWAWDGYLFGAKQYGVSLDLIDETYTHGFERRKNISNSIYNFGGYPHGYFCSAYNAGYGGAALRGDKYRDCGIKAYQFMIEHAQSGPFSWWEGIDYPDKKSPWSIPHAAGGGGSCQHIWGQSTATKVLFDSIICEKANGDIIIGRGIPSEWIYDGARIAVKKYPLSSLKRIDLDITVTATQRIVTLSGDAPCGNVTVDLPECGRELKLIIQ